MAIYITSDGGEVVIATESDTFATGPMIPSAPSLPSALPSVTAAPTAERGVSLNASGFLPASAAATGLRMLAADPINPAIGEFWYRSDSDKMSVQTATGIKRSAAFT